MNKPRCDALAELTQSSPRHPEPGSPDVAVRRTFNDLVPGGPHSVVAFTPDLIDTWIDYKRDNEIVPMRMRPHPYEFELYYDL